MKHKKCDAVFVNDVSKAGQGFESLNNAGWWIAPPEKVVVFEHCSKSELARKLISRIEMEKEYIEQTPNLRESERF